MNEQRNPRRLPLLLAAWLLIAAAHAGENREGGAGQVQIDEQTPAGETDVERMDRFVVFNRKLKTAVCDEKALSKAPSLDAVSEPEERGHSSFTVPLPRRLTESQLISFLLGDGLSGVYSEFVQAQVTQGLEARGMGGRSLSNEQFVEAQSIVSAVKRRVSADVCGALVDVSRLKSLLNARPSRFVEAGLAEGKQRPSQGPGLVATVIDSEGRFGRLGDRSKAMKILIPGWLESYEVDQVVSTTGGPAPARTYRRISNPVTNDSQGIEVSGPDGVPIGVLYVSREPTATDWTAYKAAAEHPFARARQIETYHQHIEADAVRFLQSHSDSSGQARDLQEFYKQLLKAYQLFPNEKQFDAYSRAGGRRVPSLDDVTKKSLGAGFLEALRGARVNGGSVHIALFKPDPKLHAIYDEYRTRLVKLGNEKRN